MGNTKRFWVPYAPYDIERLKEWLKEKSLEGYRLKNMKPYFAVFEESDREELKYHLEPTVKDRTKPLDEVVETRSQRGWTYAGTVPDHFHVFRSPLSTGDFHPDGQSLRWKFEEKLKKERKGLVWSVLLYFFLVLMNYYSFRESLILWIIEQLNILYIVYGTLLFSGFIGQIISYRNHKRIVEHLESGDEYYVPSSDGFRLVGFFGKGLMIAAVIGIAVASLQILSQDGSNLAQDSSFDQYPVVSLKQIESEEVPESTEEEIRFYMDTYRTGSIFLKEKLHINQTANIGDYDHYYSDLTSVYYRPKSERITEVLMEEHEKRLETGRYISYAEGEKKVINGLETVYYFGYPQHLLISDSDQFLWVKYYGNADLSKWKEEFTLKLKSFQ